ncbi:MULTISPECIES: hypothetical protein [Amycolatopsis]|uniref:Uncharacterized protein n=2 Tax=Amycolatopsis TaxID=1813 RepID=A0A1I3S4B8_9PSEU|nr:hypothetical protein [Amycolatopsis sacchari]SFJ53458.1 hypothetical protein SAMN05421835_106139 [Amycolatopsis sacchari]
MKQQNASAQRGTARARRWLTRALFVVGGAVAGTAAAWAVSTASASAETASPVSGPEAVVQQDEQATAADATEAERAEHTEFRLSQGKQVAADALEQSRRITAEVAESVQRFTQRTVVEPARQVVDTAVRVTLEPQSAPRVLSEALTPSHDVLHFLRPAATGELIKLPGLPGRTDADEQTQASAPAAANPVAPALPAGPLGPVAAVLPDAHAAAAQHLDARDQSGRQSHATQPDRFPFSPERGPLAPSGLPFGPGGSVTGGHVDGPLFGVPAGPLTVVGATGLRAVRFGIRHTPVQPGEQPGVTPD